MAALHSLESLFDIAPPGEVFECECLWCDHSTSSRSNEVAWFSMMLHLAFADGHPEADEVPENWECQLETHLYPTLGGGDA